MKEKDSELLKIEGFKELVNKGKKQGQLAFNEIMAIFQNMDIAPEQIEEIYEYLSEMCIRDR